MDRIVKNKPVDQGPLELGNGKRYMRPLSNMFPECKIGKVLEVCWAERRKRSSVTMVD
jgi:hypothetical protein